MSKAHEAVREILRHLGEDPDREGLKETPRRVIAALEAVTAGGGVDVKKLLSVSFDSGDYDQVIGVTNIPFTSTCEHHLLPFSGRASLAYLPAQDKSTKRWIPQLGELEPPKRYRVVGLSKVPRLVDAFAQRLQLQEQLTSQIATAFALNVEPRGVAVKIVAEHSCVSCRGVRKSGIRMITCDLRGVFRDNYATRAEVLRYLEE